MPCDGPATAETAAPPRASPGLPALARCRTDGGLQRAVVDTDVLSVEARAAIGTAVGQAQPPPGQVLELHLIPRADDEVITRVLTRAAAHDHVALHHGAGEERVQRLG